MCRCCSIFQRTIRPYMPRPTSVWYSGRQAMTTVAFTLQQSWCGYKLTDMTSCLLTNDIMLSSETVDSHRCIACTPSHGWLGVRTTQRCVDAYDHMPVRYRQKSPSISPVWNHQESKIWSKARMSSKWLHSDAL